jgi:hypothetical protein
MTRLSGLVIELLWIKEYGCQPVSPPQGSGRRWDPAVGNEGERAVVLAAYTETMRAALTLALLSTCWLYGQISPKDKAADYPVHANAGAVEIGAEYLVHSIPGGRQTFIASEYLVFEVAVFPGRGEAAEIRTGTFTLRVNGKKQALYPDSPGFVAASLKYPDWEQRPNAQIQAGLGDAGVTLGRPPVVGRFPGDPTPSQSRLPRSPRAPDPDDRRGVEREEPEHAEDVVARTALPEGAATKPVSGYLFFRYQGKAKSIKSLELIYQGKAESVALKLM